MEEAPDGNCFSNGNDFQQKCNGSATDDRDALGKPGSSISCISALMPSEADSPYYNMDHPERGLAIIFNHENFDKSQSLNPRAGTKHDCVNLEERLKALHFQVTAYHDLKFSDVMKVIKKVSEADHSKHDCLLIAVLSHGQLGVIHAYDVQYKAENLWSPFTANLCPTLAGKPKLFFVQACQGDMLDAGVTLYRDKGAGRTEVDGQPNSYKIPSQADFLIAYSTVPGFYSWRNTMKGSWYVQALCEELLNNGFKLDVLELLTNVTRRVALDFESNTPNDYSFHQKRQVPFTTSTLMRKVLFTRKGLERVEVKDESHSTPRRSSFSTFFLGASKKTYSYKNVCELDVVCIYFEREKIGVNSKKKTVDIQTLKEKDVE